MASISEKPWVELIVVVVISAVLFTYLVNLEPRKVTSIEVEDTKIISGTGIPSKLNNWCIIQLTDTGEKIAVVCNKRVRTGDNRKVTKSTYSDGKVNYSICSDRSVVKECQNK